MSIIRYLWVYHSLCFIRIVSIGVFMSVWALMGVTVGVPVFVSVDVSVRVCGRVSGRVVLGMCVCVYLFMF